VGRLIILILVIVTVIVLWRAFGPGSGDRVNGRRSLDKTPKKEVKGPDDDPDFMWEIRKERFKAQRAKERLAEESLRSAEARAKDAERRAAEAEKRAEDAETQARAERPDTSRQDRPERQDPEEPGAAGSAGSAGA